ncbi:inorganic phosphate transporter [Falsigemmobacter faecalis]|uniref:Phosphate transporter n=1 Tax=Falsigemmobacter faecalis TaxID=2488730 RepID=A0A3P3DW27_9RHOB|nr:inorganic phosphate transporter [Falsigemmobacter faecalis]RRH78473.1 inorganic phosphate transporter [Falsigemmobacter faecalis]
MALPPDPQWKTLDKDLGRIGTMELAGRHVARPLLAPGLALAFMAIVALGSGIVPVSEGGGLPVILASILAAYLALTIGANDVANNVGPAVGARALTLGGALILAAVCEVAGALIAGSDVVATISDGIIHAEAFPSQGAFVRAMMAALLATAVWLHLATWAGAAVSTTHSIVGGVAGAAIAAAGPQAVDWGLLAVISLSWVASPLVGGVLAAALLAFINRFIAEAGDRLAAARLWLPVLMALMAGAFTVYLGARGLAVHTGSGWRTALVLGLGVALLTWAFARPLVRRQAEGLSNKRKALKKLFSPLLVISAALLSFGHGASDVSNAVAPLAAIVSVYSAGGGGAYMEAVGLPFWVMAIGGAGIALGLLLFGPRLVLLVGKEITRLNPVRAFCVALATAVAVIAAAAMGLPVSSTHIAVGAIFGLGFYREWREAARGRKIRDDIHAPAEERHRRRLVRRSHVLTMLTAWIITVPLTAALAGAVFFLLSKLTA